MSLNRLFTALLLMLGTHITMADPSPSSKQTDNKMQTGAIVIHGASYAKGWNPPTLAGLPVINTGVGGEESGQILARLQVDVIQRKPRAVILWGYINDIARSQGDMAATRDKAYRNVAEMVDRVAKAGLTPILATEVTITTRDSFMDQVVAVITRLRGKESYQTVVNREVRAVNDRLRALATERKILLLDFEKSLSDKDGFRKREYAQEDGSHLTEAAYRALTTYAEPLIKSQLGANPDRKR